MTWWRCDIRGLKARASRLGVSLLAAGVLTTWLVPVLALPASAEMTNGCTGTLAGQNVGTRSSTDPNQAIQVQWDQSAMATVTSTAQISGYHVDLEFAGIPFTVAHGASNGNSWSQAVEVRQYALYGVGLYKVIGTSTGPGACSASFLVNIVGKDPLTTPAGLLAAAVLAIGALGTAAATIASAAGTPVHARRYIADLQAVESNQAPAETLDPYIADYVNVPIGDDFHYVPDAVNVQPTDDFHYVPDAINVQPTDDFHYVPDAITVPEVQASDVHDRFVSDAVDVREVYPRQNEFPPDAVNVREVYPMQHEFPSDAINVQEDIQAPPPDAVDVPGPPPRRGI